MSAVKRVPFSYFLTERKFRIKPAEANTLGLKRVDKIDFSANIHLSDRTTNTDMILVKPGDLLISGINAEKGAVTVYQGEEDVLASIHYSSYEYDPGKIDIEFLKWFLKSSNFKRLLSEKSTGGIKTELKAKHLLPLEIDLPDPKIQKSIVRLIESRSDAVNKTSSEISSQLDDLQRLRQSILREAVQGRLVPQDKSDEPASELLKKIKAEKETLVKAGKLKKEKPLSPISEEEIPFELPKGWGWCRLSEIAYVGNGSTPPANEFTSDPQDVPYLKVYNIVNQKVDFDYKPQYVSRKCHETRLKRSICYSGDVIMNIVGPPLGKIAIVPIEIPQCNINQAIVVIRPLKKILNTWVYYFLNEKTAISKIVTKGTAGQDNISVTQSRNIVIPIPPFVEQRRIVSKVDSLMATCDALEFELKSAHRDTGKLMQTVLKEAFAF